MKKNITLGKQFTAVGIFLLVIILGLFLPILKGNPDAALDIETIMFISASCISVFILLTTNISWDELFKSMTKSISDALPGLLILIVIGPLIAGFIMSGLMPMLVYYGIKIIDPKFIYAISLILAALFSIFTGTSWGSAATIGVVAMGIGNAIGARPEIVAGAVIGGAYFGDKLSPLSDTTNMAAIASKVDLYDHVGSMLWTTVPSTIISLIVFTIAGFVFPATAGSINDPRVTTILNDLSGMFNFNILLIIPLLIVLIGSAMRKPVLPVMVVGAFISFVFAFIFQNFTFTNILDGLHSGFKLEMVDWFKYSLPVKGEAYIIGFFEKGGFWELGNLIPISTSILATVGTLNSINAMPAVANVIFGKVKTRAAIIISSLVTAIAMIGITSNGIACSFVTADIFGEKYDENGISRKVLSRTTEDAGTMLEVLFPWTPAAIFFVQTLGISTIDYIPWAILNWITPVVAIFLAVSGIGTYKNEKKKINK
ncbi:Na+/H+ antiporter NhaC family protein [Miniphocaeibacter halophilus]|uniref:Sodium:proton antiporter n=1 Tax=Miniphocaeibacter halophilus TaxID=2931922 RepID=A0AC61NGL9_9FIRM|nr:Na+/H+ antiporter NhaC family protein [Miniphocaeibacter halophilus]QQK09008.1 sodium:proton antiporter [Miniphocaeibacter halophilus]